MIKRLSFFILFMLLLISCETTNESTITTENTGEKIVEPQEEKEVVVEKVDEKKQSRPVKIAVKPAPRKTASSKKNTSPKKAPLVKKPIKTTPKKKVEPVVEEVISVKEEPVTNEPDEPAIEEKIPEVEETASEDEVVATFGDVTITQQDYIDTKLEISEVVDNLNDITANNNYNRWLKYLSQEYIDNFSNPAVLKKSSKALPIKNIKLKNLKDYFKFVFVPSRKNIRVDDIKFISPTEVNVIMTTNKRSLLVYILENVNGQWKLVPKN